MPKKKTLYESESEPPVLFPPEQFYFREGNVLILSHTLDEWPSVAPHKYSNAVVLHILEAWMEDNHLQDTTWEEWYQCLEPIRGILELSGDDRKKYFKYFKSTRQRKLSDAIRVLGKVLKSLESINAEIWNEEVRLDYIHEPISQELLPITQNKLEQYQEMQVFLKHTSTGDHVLLEGRLGPFIEKMGSYGLNKDQKARALCGLLQRFNYEQFNLLNEKQSLEHKPRYISKTTKPSLMNEQEKFFVKSAEGIIARSLDISIR